MGYRVRLGRVPKTVRKEFQGFESDTQLYEFFEQHHPHDAAYRPPFHEELFELGMYVDFKKDDVKYEDFYGFELPENDFIIIDRDGLVHIINMFRKNVISWYRGLLETIDEGDVNQVRRHIDNKLQEWDNPYYEHHLRLDQVKSQADVDGMLTKSYKFEYGVFNLLYILHTFDWENDYLIYSGW